MNKGHDQNSEERIPFNLFHAAIERDKHHIEMVREGQINIFEAAHQKEKEEAKQKMIEQALAKLTNEMANNKGNAYVQVIGDYLVNFVKNNPPSAKKVMDEKKSIVGSLDAMRKEAEKKKQNNCAVLTDQEGFKIVLGYLGIENKEPIAQKPVQETTPPVTASIETALPNKQRFEASLDDFL